MMASLDHAMWFHRPFRADEWLLYHQLSPSASGARGLALGHVFRRRRRRRRDGHARRPDPTRPGHGPSPLNAQRRRSRRPALRHGHDPDPRDAPRMADAEVGDDEYGEDPTVQPPRVAAAGLLGTDAALYVTSGTMANQLAPPRPRPARHRGALRRAGPRLPLRARRRRPATRAVQLRPIPDPDGDVPGRRDRPRPSPTPASTCRPCRRSRSRTRTCRPAAGPGRRPRARARWPDAAHAAGCPSTATAPGSGTRRSRSACPPRELCAPRRHRDVLLLEGSRARRSGRSCAARAADRRRPG